MIAHAYLRYGLLKQAESGRVRLKCGRSFFSLQRTQVSIRCLCKLIPLFLRGIRLHN